MPVTQRTTPDSRPSRPTSERTTICARINVFTQGAGYMDPLGSCTERLRERLIGGSTAGLEEKGERLGEALNDRGGIGRRPMSTIRYIALQGIYRFAGSYQLSLLGDISMISAEWERRRNGEETTFLQIPRPGRPQLQRASPHNPRQLSIARRPARKIYFTAHRSPEARLSAGPARGKV